MRNRLIHSLTVMVMIFIAMACQKDPVHPTADGVVERTTPKQALVTVNVDVPLESGVADCEVGIAYGKAGDYLNGTVQEVLAEEPVGASGSLQLVLKHLECGTLYRFHTFIRCGEESFVGETREFKTAPLPQNAVDLHLSNDLLWADRNVGAMNVNDDGDLFSFGEISPKEKYVMGNYKFYDDYNSARSPKISKYVIPDGNEDQPWYDKDGVFSGDGKSVLDIEDDAAASMMGAGWRLPTKEEYKLLTAECVAAIERSSTANGLKLTSSNGTELHLPSSKMYDSSFHSEDAWGHYLTSSMWVGDEKVTIQSASSEYFSCLWFSAANGYDDKVGYLTVYPLPRIWGLPARGVYDCSVVPEPVKQWEGFRNVGKLDVPELSDKPNDLVKYGDPTSRMPVTYQSLGRNSSSGVYTSLSLVFASGMNIFMASFSFDDISGIDEGEEIVPRSCYAGFQSSSSSSATTYRMYGTVRLMSKQDNKFIVRFENVRFRVLNEKWVLNGTYSFDAYAQ